MLKLKNPKKNLKENLTENLKKSPGRKLQKG